MSGRRLAPLLTVVLAAAAARADVVYLKNGNKMEGVVTSETKTTIDLDIGYGSATLSKDDILRIQRSGKNAPGKTEKTIEYRRFESGTGIPKGAEKLDAAYRGAAGLREKAFDARLKWNALSDEKASLEEEQPDLKRRHKEASAGLQDTDPVRDNGRYNAFVVESNRASTRLEDDALRLQDIAKEQDAADADVHAYMDAYRGFRDALAGEDGKRVAAGSPEEKDYSAWATAQSRAMSRDFREDSVPAKSEGNQLFVDVVLNGGVTGRFLVDTGASTTLLYKDVASRLKLPAAARVGRAKTKVADGRTVEADVVMLESIAVGKSRVARSLATVVPATGQGFDGLLGMSFLGHFIARVDISNGRLILEDLK